jgi:hypothetical protein
MLAGLGYATAPMTRDHVRTLGQMAAVSNLTDLRRWTIRKLSYGGVEGGSEYTRPNEETSFVSILDDDPGTWGTSEDWRTDDPF